MHKYMTCTGALAWCPKCGLRRLPSAFGAIFGLIAPNQQLCLYRVFIHYYASITNFARASEPASNTLRAYVRNCTSEGSDTLLHGTSTHEQSSKIIKQYLRMRSPPFDLTDLPNILGSDPGNACNVGVACAELL